MFAKNFCCNAIQFHKKIHEYEGILLNLTNEQFCEHPNLQTITHKWTK
jgi:hypothetical protein